MRSYRQERTADLKRLLERKNAAAGIAVANEAKRRAGVDTGRLRASITSDSDENGAIVGTNVEYAHFHHNGTRYQDPNPFLVDGLLASADELRRIYEG